MVAFRDAGRLFWVEVTTRTERSTGITPAGEVTLTAHDSEFLDVPRVGSLGSGPVVATGPLRALWARRTPGATNNISFLADFGMLCGEPSEKPRVGGEVLGPGHYLAVFPAQERYA